MASSQPDLPKSDYTKGQIVSIVTGRSLERRGGVVVEVKDSPVMVLVVGKSKPVAFSRYTQSAFSEKWSIA